MFIFPAELVAKKVTNTSASPPVTYVHTYIIALPPKEGLKEP